MVITSTDADTVLLARIMRAEALNEGDLGMLMVGNVVVNRVIANCLTFKNVNNVYDSVYQKNQFSGTSSSLFQAYPTALEKRLAERSLKGEYYHPATHSLWFYAPGSASCKSTWYNQALSGKYKNHCFYKPDPGVCHTIY